MLHPATPLRSQTQPPRCVPSRRERNVGFCVSHPLTIDIAAAVTEIPDKRWQPAASSDASELREHAEVTEITEHVDLSNRPKHTCMIARRENPHPGAQLTFCDSQTQTPNSQQPYTPPHDHRPSHTHRRTQPNPHNHPPTTY